MNINGDCYRKLVEVFSWPFHNYVNIGQSCFQQNENAMEANGDCNRKVVETSSWPYHKYVNIGQLWFQQFGNAMKINGDCYRKVAVTSSCLAIIILTLVSHGSNSLGMS